LKKKLKVEEGQIIAERQVVLMEKGLAKNYDYFHLHGPYKRSELRVKMEKSLVFYLF